MSWTEKSKFCPSERKSANDAFVSAPNMIFTPLS